MDMSIKNDKVAVSIDDAVVGRNIFEALMYYILLYLKMIIENLRKIKIF